MIAAAPYLTDLFLSMSALVGLGVLHHTITSRDVADPINRRFLFGVRVTMLLFAGRALVVVTGGHGFRALVLLAAALIPLAVILLAEGLLRRHAHPAAKLAVAVGTVGFAVLAFFPAGVVDPDRLWGMLAFQVGAFVIAGWMIVQRDRTSLSQAENRMAVRLGLSLILLIPLAAADFLIVQVGLPVQVSPLAVLFLGWLAISLGRAQSGTVAMSGFLVVAVAAVLAGGLIAVLAGLDRSGAIQVTAICIAAMLAATVFNDASVLRAEARNLSLLRFLAGRGDDPVDFLRGLQSHPLVDGAVLIEGAALSDLDAPVLGRIFAAAPVLRRAAPPSLGGVEDDHIAHLFNRYAATHVLLVRVDPLLLIALSLPGLAASPVAELELQAVQRMAVLMQRPG